MATLANFLRTAPWATGLSPEQLQRLEREVTERSIAADAYLCHRGEPAAHWIGVIEGLVKLQTSSAAGKPVALAGVATGGWFGEGSVLKTEPRRYEAVALRPSRVAYMPRATFKWLYDSNVGFNHYLVQQLNERLSQFIGRVEYERLLSLEARVARCLAMLYDPQLSPGTDARLAISQEEIGLLSGVARSRVNRALHLLADKNLLRVEYGGITILDVDGLRSYGP